VLKLKTPTTLVQTLLRHIMARALHLQALVSMLALEQTKQLVLLVLLTQVRLIHKTLS
jgi:hypothetical protein